MKYRKHIVPLALIAIAFTLPSVLHHTLLHVVTPSIPPGWYLVERFGPPHVGDYVVACLPLSLATAGLRRRYLIPGDCPSGVAPLAKILAAQAGDIVTISPDGVRVNNTRVAAAPTTHDTRGRPLYPLPRGTYLVQADTMWLLGTSAHSWDSRYFGPVSSKSIIGRAHPLITDPSAVSQ